MLKRLLIITLIFIPNLCYSQNVLDGIFELRLGMSEVELKSTPGVEIKTYEAISQEAVFETSKGRELILESYEPFKDFIIENIELIFYKDILYSIEITKYNPKTEQLLTEKYGNPKTRKKEEIEAIPYGERTNKRENYRIVGDTEINTWKTNDKSIICSSEYYSKRGEFSSSYSLTIKNIQIEKKAVKEILQEYIEKKAEISNEMIKAF